MFEMKREYRRPICQKSCREALADSCERLDNGVQLMFRYLVMRISQNPRTGCLSGIDDTRREPHLVGE